MGNSKTHSLHQKCVLHHFMRTFGHPTTLWILPSERKKGFLHAQRWEESIWLDYSSSPFLWGRGNDKVSLSHTLKKGPFPTSCLAGATSQFAYYMHYPPFPKGGEELRIYRTVNDITIFGKKSYSSRGRSKIWIGENFFSLRER